MAAVAASSAKRSLRAELKQRLRALSAEERLRQSHLLTQKVREGCGELKAWKRGLGLNVCAGAPLPLCVRVLVGARSHLQSGPVGLGEDPADSSASSQGRPTGHVCSFQPSYFAVVDTHCCEL